MLGPRVSGACQIRNSPHKESRRLPRLSGTLKAPVLRAQLTTSGAATRSHEQNIRQEAASLRMFRVTSNEGNAILVANIPNLNRGSKPSSPTKVSRRARSGCPAISKCFAPEKGREPSLLVLFEKSACGFRASGSQLALKFYIQWCLYYMNNAK